MEEKCPEDLRIELAGFREEIQQIKDVVMEQQHLTHLKGIWERLGGGDRQEEGDVQVQVVASSNIVSSQGGWRVVDCNGASSSCDDASTAISFDSYFKINRSLELCDRYAVEADSFEPAFVDVSELYSSCGTRPVLPGLVLEASGVFDEERNLCDCMRTRL